MSLRLPVLSLLLFAAAPICVSAQSHSGLTDPTRPPPEAQLQAPGAVPAPSGPHKPVLQSVLVGKGHDGREVAVIDGEVVRKGQSFHGAVLEEVGTNVAVLRRGKTTETLILFPLAAGSRKK